MDRTITLRIASIPFPDGVAGGCMLKGPDNYVVVVNESSSEREQVETFLHECLHIWHDDHNSGLPASLIETIRTQEFREIACAASERAESGF